MPILWWAVLPHPNKAAHLLSLLCPNRLSEGVVDVALEQVNIPVLCDLHAGMGQELRDDLEGTAGDRLRFQVPDRFRRPTATRDRPLARRRLCGVLDEVLNVNSNHVFADLQDALLYVDIVPFHGQRLAGFIRQALNLPAHVAPFAVVPMGYPAEERAAGERAMEDRIHWDRW